MIAGWEQQYCLNIAEDDDINIDHSDEGGEDQGPCSLTMPRGCVECVVGRTRTSPITVKDRGGFVMKAGGQ